MAANQIGTVSVGVELDASGLPKQLKTVGTKIGDVLGSTVKFGVGAAVAGVGAGAAAIGGAAAVAFSKGFERLQSIDMARSKLKGLKFDAAAIESVMDSALKAVKGTAFGLGDAATVASIFGATGIKAGDQMTKALKLTADMATVGGTSLSDMGSVLSDVSAMGKVTGDTLNRLGERGIDALGNIASHLGVTREEARKMVSAGKVSFDEFAAAMDENIGGAAMSSGETFQGAMANIMAAAGRLGAGALGPAFEAIKAIAPTIITAIDGITEAFKPIFEEVGPKVAGVIQGIGDTIAKIDWATVATVVQDAWHAVEDLFGRLFTATQTFIERFGPVWDEVGSAVNSIDWQTVGDTIVGVWETVIGVFEGVYDAIEDIIGAVQPQLTQIFEDAGDAVEGTDWEAVSETFREWAGRIIKLWAAFKLLQGVALIFKGIRTAVVLTQGVFTALTAAVSAYRAGMTITSAISAGLEAANFGVAASVWASTVAFLASPITWIVIGIMALIAAVVLLMLNWDKVVKFITDVWSGFIDWFTGVMDGFLDWWEGLWSSVTGFFEDIWEGIKGFFEPIIDGIVNFVKDHWGLLLSFLIGPLGLAIQWIVENWEGIMAFFKDAIDKFMAWWTPIWDFIAAAVKLAVDLIVNFFRFWAAVAKWLWENAIQPALQAIADFFGWLWETAIQPIVDFIVDAWEYLGGVIEDVWENYIQPALKAVGDFFTWLWEQVIKIVIDQIERQIRGWGLIFEWLYDNIVKPVFDAIAAAFDWIWNSVIKPIIDYFIEAFETWGRIFTWLYEQVIKPVWEGIQTAFKNAWDWIDRNVFTPFKDGIGLIQQAFQNVADALPEIWNSIKKAVAEPINFVLGTIWNDGLRSFWNDLVTELDLKDMKLPKAKLVSFARGGVLPGYTPGRDVHQFFSPTGGRLALSGGEGIIRPDALRRLGGKRWLDQVNRSRGRGIGDGEGQNWVGDVWDAVQKGAAVAWEFFANPGSAIKKYVVDGIIRPLLSSGNPNIFGQTVGGYIANFVGGFADIFDKASPAAAGGAGMGWEAMWKIVKAAIPGVTLNSSFRPGAKTVNGGQSYHSSGRAIDLGPANMNIFNQVRRLFPNAAELIYTPAGLKQLQNGKPRADWSAAVKRMHYNHIHLAMKNGGIFDNGGMLAPGAMGMNLSRKPEAVFTAAQFAALEKNLVQMDRLLGAVDSRAPRGSLFANTSREMNTTAASNNRTMTVEAGAIQIAGPDPYAVSLMTVNRLSEMAAMT